MKNKLITLAVSTLLVCVPNAFAHEKGDGVFLGKDTPGNWIAGIKLAKVKTEDLNNVNAIGIVLGYEFNRPIAGDGSSTVEFEYLTTDHTDVSGINQGSWDADIMSLYFTYRSAGMIYFKAKVGAQKSSVNLSGVGLSSKSEKTELAGGIGLGMHIDGYGVIEAEYSVSGGNNSLDVIGVNVLLEF